MKSKLIYCVSPFTTLDQIPTFIFCIIVRLTYSNVKLNTVTTLFCASRTSDIKSQWKISQVDYIITHQFNYFLSNTVTKFQPRFASIREFHIVILNNSRWCFNNNCCDLLINKNILISQLWDRKYIWKTC